MSEELTDEQYLLAGKALMALLDRVRSGDVKGTSLENNLAYFEKDGQAFRVHLSKLEEPYIYTLANKESGQVLDFVNNKEDEEVLEELEGEE